MKKLSSLLGNSQRLDGGVLTVVIESSDMFDQAENPFFGSFFAFFGQVALD